MYKKYVQIVILADFLRALLLLSNGRSIICGYIGIYPYMDKVVNYIDIIIVIMSSSHIFRSKPVHELADGSFSYQLASVQDIQSLL
jgi:hypothetical protein